MAVNSMKPDQTAPLGAVWSRSILFAVKADEKADKLAWMMGKELVRNTGLDK